MFTYFKINKLYNINIYLFKKKLNINVTRNDKFLYLMWYRKENT